MGQRGGADGHALVHERSAASALAPVVGASGLGGGVGDSERLLGSDG